MLGAGFFSIIFFFSSIDWLALTSSSSSSSFSNALPVLIMGSWTGTDCDTNTCVGGVCSFPELGGC